MTAISVSWTQKTAADWDAGKPLTTTHLNQLYDSVEYVKQWLGDSFIGGAVKDHNHDGLNSSLIEAGPNLLRNGSFESGSNGWTLTTYTGGTIAVGSTGAMHGIACLAITSTSTANGGGYATSNEYLPVAPGMTYFASQLVKASVANVSSKLEIIWYDSAKSQISASSYSTTNTPTTATPVSVIDAAPSTAAYARVRATGGVPSSGSATGTIYADGAVFSAAAAGALIKFTTITASDASWAKQLNTTHIVACCIGGGGGGGSATAGAAKCGSDGGDGHTAWVHITGASATYAATIGAGGTAASAGGNTSFGATTATGGVAGVSDYYGGGSVQSSPAAESANSGLGGHGAASLASSGYAGGTGGSGVIFVWEFA